MSLQCKYAMYRLHWTVHLRKPCKQTELFNSFIAKQWMSFCGEGEKLAEICVDGCDVVSKNSGSEVEFEQPLTK